MRKYMLPLAMTATLVLFNYAVAISAEDKSREVAEKAVTADYIVTIIDGPKGTRKFDPDKLKVKKNQSVMFVSKGGDHSATSDDLKTANADKTFHTGWMKKDQKCVIHFNTAQIYKYSCAFHPADMKGEIEVEP